MMSTPPVVYYRDQRAWRDLQAFLPERLRLTEANSPAEEFWEWRGHHVHLDRYINPDAPAKIVLHHGVGTNGRQMSLIVGAPLAARGFETVALDNLGYGLTQVRPGAVVSYDDWVDLVVDFLAYEQSRDDRPIILYGLSAGGMLTYHVAAKAPKGTLRGIVGMTFLDQRVQKVRDQTSHDVPTSRIGMPVMELLAHTPAARVKIPMTVASKMSALTNDPQALKIMIADRTSGGNWVPIRFLANYMSYTPAVEPRDFDACPVLLTQPAEDRWSPLEFSQPVISQITRVPVRTVMLTNAGHYPLEEPGLTQMQDAIAEFVTANSGARPA
ncbi:AB hydrolase superfamily protein, Lysophospholipase [Mycolicibacterium canariasense]|uniref:AB hydrolase superfamily protein, Lysophospholipase n=2 Tax=Mycolicibacterium canariasense TaxID=228230 RepID=A0A100WGY4_MYCCR|nr:AB hydrolase superfamily protein, Lysophospholipase [Mycolicibacterium canariasense]